MDWTAAKGFGATVTGTGCQLPLHTLWPSCVVSTRSQAAVGWGSQSSSPGHGCDQWALDHTVPWEQQLPVLQSPTLHRTQLCWAARAESHKDAGSGADAARARPL